VQALASDDGDLRWIDSVSEEVLGKIVDSEANLRLLLLTTHRMEYAPPWLDRAVVTNLHLGPLPSGDIRRLVQARIGGEALPSSRRQALQCVPSMGGGARTLKNRVQKALGSGARRERRTGALQDDNSDTRR
jgi:hypothetical protein